MKSQIGEIVEIEASTLPIFKEVIRKGKAERGRMDNLDVVFINKRNGMNTFLSCLLNGG